MGQARHGSIGLLKWTVKHCVLLDILKVVTSAQK